MGGLIALLYLWFHNNVTLDNIGIYMSPIFRPNCFFKDEKTFTMPIQGKHLLMVNQTNETPNQLLFLRGNTILNYWELQVPTLSKDNTTRPYLDKEERHWMFSLEKASRSSEVHVSVKCICGKL